MSKSVRAGLTFNLKPADAAAHGDAFEEFDSIETIEALERALRANGHEPVRIGYGAALLDADVDFVFNIAEGFGGRGRESHVPAVCELLGIPCTGSDPLTIGITLDKALAKTYAKAHGIAVAGDWRFPLFVKPACEGSSMGITKSSLCRTPEELQAVVAQMSKYGAVLIEEFLPGEEYTVGIVQGEVLGVMQVVPRSQEPDFVYSIDVKRDYENLVDYKLVQADDVAQLALDVWREFGLRDVARIDVRRDRDGVPCFIEVNPLPGVHPKHSDLVIMARLAGVAYEELIGRIVARVIPSVVEGPGWAVGAPPVPPGPSTTLGMTVTCHAERSRGIPSGRSESRASAGDSSTVFAARNDTDATVIPSVVEGPGWAVGAPPVPPGPSTTLGMTVTCHAERSRGIPSGRSESRASAGDSSTVFAARNDTDATVIPSVVEGPGWAVGAPPVPPGPSTTLGMTVTCH